MFKSLKKIVSNKFIKYTFLTVAGVFSLIGFFLTSTFLAVKFHITDDPGAVDYNDRYFQEIKDKYNQSFVVDSSNFELKESEIFHKILILNKYYPKNAGFILNAYLESKNIQETERMIDAVNLYMQGNKEYITEVNQYNASIDKNKSKRVKGSIFEWMNISEWTDFKYAVAKDKRLIDSVAGLTGVEPRMIVAVLVGEQIRLFNSQREAFKKWIGPLKILSVETTFSLGVTGIKEETAIKTERNLKDTTSVFYIGKKYEHMLDINSDSVSVERFRRLTSYKNHFYSYMYAALILRQIKVQWERAGYPVHNRPEIMATLFNVGFEMSKPNPNPRVGGSTIMIQDKPYTFGAIAYEFYYSGELFDLFPFKNSKFDWNNV